MAINGKHTTEVMIFPRVRRGARRSVCLRACTCTTRTRRHCWYVGRAGWRGGGWFLCTRERAYHSIRTLALGLLNATSACSLVRKGICLSIHLLGALRGSGGSQEEEGGCWCGRMVGTYVLSASLITERCYAARVYTRAHGRR